MIERCGNCGATYCWGDCYAGNPVKRAANVPDPQAAREMNRIMQNQRPFSAATPKGDTPDA